MFVLKFRLRRYLGENRRVYWDPLQTLNENAHSYMPQSTTIRYRASQPAVYPIPQFQHFVNIKVGSKAGLKELRHLVEPMILFHPSPLREGPIPAKMAEYLAEYTRWHSHSRHSSQVITVKEVTIKSDESKEDLHVFQTLP